MDSFIQRCIEIISEKDGKSRLGLLHGDMCRLLVIENQSHKNRAAVGFTAALFLCKGILCFCSFVGMVQHLAGQIKPEIFVFFHVLDETVRFPCFQSHVTKDAEHHLAADFCKIQLLGEVEGNDIGRNGTFGKKDGGGETGIPRMSSARKGDVWNAHINSRTTGFFSVM